MIEKKSMDELNRPSVDDYKSTIKFPVSIVLDNVRSAYNVGSVFRTSDAFNIEKVYLCGITAAGDNREVLKTALGASDSVAWEHHPDIKTVLKALKEKQYTIWSVEQVHNSLMLSEIAAVPLPLALVFGNEVNGVDKEALVLSDNCVEIPQFGTKHSFNISVSAGIVLWHLSFIWAQSATTPS